MGLSQVTPAELIQEENFSLKLARKPEAVIAEAGLAANALMAAVRRNNWAQKFGNSKEHLYFEAWALLSSMYRVTPRVRETRYIETGNAIGYEAFAEAFHIPSQTVISTADAMCLNDEDNWSSRPKYEWQGPQGQRTKVKVGDERVPLFQLRSMAQTRALAKALKGPFSWIVAMAGYAPRAAEEGDVGLSENEAQPSAPPPPIRQPQRKPASTEGTITPPQASRIFALGHSAGKNQAEVVKILQSFGFESARDVTSERYEAICAEVAKGDAQ